MDLSPSTSSYSPSTFASSPSTSCSSSPSTSSLSSPSTSSSSESSPESSLDDSLFKRPGNAVRAKKSLAQIQRFKTLQIRLKLGTMEADKMCKQLKYNTVKCLIKLRIAMKTMEKRGLQCDKRYQMLIDACKFVSKLEKWNGSNVAAVSKSEGPYVTVEGDSDGLYRMRFVVFNEHQLKQFKTFVALYKYLSRSQVPPSTTTTLRRRRR